VNDKVWLVEIDGPPARLLDAAADLALDLRRGEWKPLVGPARRDTKAPAGAIAEVFENRAANVSRSSSPGSDRSGTRPAYE